MEVPWEDVQEASRSSLDVHLRLLMKEREDVMAKLVELDRATYELEERLRRDNCTD